MPPALLMMKRLRKNAEVVADVALRAAAGSIEHDCSAVAIGAHHRRRASAVEI
jgi:hypothetical protein